MLVNNFFGEDCRAKKKCAQEKEGERKRANKNVKNVIERGCCIIEIAPNNVCWFMRQMCMCENYDGVEKPIRYGCSMWMASSFIVVAFHHTHTHSNTECDNSPKLIITLLSSKMHATICVWKMDQLFSSCAIRCVWACMCGWMVAGGRFKANKRHVSWKHTRTRISTQRLQWLNVIWWFYAFAKDVFVYLCIQI